MHISNNGKADSKSDAQSGANAGAHEVSRTESTETDDLDDFFVTDDFADDPYGFTEDEILELAAQGIKPCDPEAREILTLLHSNDSAAGDK